MALSLGLALGAGAAKGWAHIGIIRELQAMGLQPDVVVGTSIGSLVGGAYVADYLDELEAWITELTWSDVIALLDIRLAGGLIKGDRLLRHLGEGMDGINIEDLAKPYAAVATDLESGHEVWLRDGSILQAIRASIAIPPLFSPARVNDRWLVDGGMVNPVPVSLCRALGADVVIAVDLNNPNHFQSPSPSGPSSKHEAQAALEKAHGFGVFNVFDGVLDKMNFGREPEPEVPSLLDVISSSVNIMTSRISRSRMAGEPAEICLVPRVNDIGLMEFHRGSECIAMGREEVGHHSESLLALKRHLNR